MKTKCLKQFESLTGSKPEISIMITKKSVNNSIQHQFKFNVHPDLLFEQKMAMNITEAILFAKLDESYLKDSNVPKVSRLFQIIPFQTLK